MGNITTQGRGRKKNNLKKTQAFLSIKKKFIPTQFSLHFGENILVGLGRKHLGTTIYFPSSLPNQTHTKKVFLPIFSPKFSIYPISPPNKRTLRERHWAQGCSQASFDGWEAVMGINYLGLSCRWIRLLLQKNTSSLFWLCIN